MSNVQRVIKYLSIAFAFFLIFNILSGIISGISILSNITSNKEDYEILEELKELAIQKEVKIIEVDIASSNMTIKIGDSLKAETTNKYIECKQDNNKLYIKEKDHHWFHNNDISNLIITIPKDMILDGVTINSGAGKIELEELSTRLLNLDLGAGKVNINHLTVLSKTKIDGGAGEVNIDNSCFHNLDLNMGIGKFTLTAKLTGNSEIDHGVGEANLNLIGTLEDYQIHLDKGIGTTTIDKKEIKDDEIIGTGRNKVDIDGGIGKIQIHITEEKTTSQTFTKTYQLLNISKSNEENSYYLTLQLFQGEVATVLVKDINNQLESGKNYEFTFATNSKTIEDNIKSIFENSTILSIKETSKIGLEQIQDSIE